MSAPDQDKPVRYFMGMKKEGGVPIAPWGGSTFEENCKDAKKCTEYDDVFLPVGSDCRTKPIKPESDANKWLTGNNTADRALSTSNRDTYAQHPRQQPVAIRRREDHTSTFIDKSKHMTDCSTYSHCFWEKSDTRPPKPCRPGTPEKFMEMGEKNMASQSVNSETYREYSNDEVINSKRAPICIAPEYGSIVPTKVPLDTFKTNYASNYLQTKQIERVNPLRPVENGIHYDLTNKSSMTTTHDRTYNNPLIKPERVVTRSEPVGGPNQLSTMMSDFQEKSLDQQAKPFLPPVGLRRTFGDVDTGYSTGYQQNFGVPDRETHVPVKNCKPDHVLMSTCPWTKLSEKMEGKSTAHSHFSGSVTAPAKSCKPNYTGVRDNGWFSHKVHNTESADPSTE